ncbi:MAG: hypothetical protein L0Y39_01765 [Methylococcaceae bacterium]|nr:hypothetical protein [Methylococcaceae bacterium]
MEKTTGGQSGGGAVLTEAGEHAIDCFRVAYRDFNAILDERSRRLDL